MASCLQKLLRKSSPTKLVSALRNPQSPNPTPLPLLHPQILCAEPRPNHEQNPNHLLPFSGTFKAENLTHSTHYQSPVFYPSFPFGLISDTIYLPGSIQSEPDDDDVSGGSGILWADSVKKKRKKKMNKHKYKKLRKRLRRKT
ncbi:hypothetical protein SLE2022_194130 [Rubroshorea leprosula]